MVDIEEERWADRCLDRAIELDAMEGTMAENDRQMFAQEFDPVDPYEHRDYLRRKAIRDAETPKQRAARLNREQREGEQYLKNHDAGHTCLGDILGAALAKKRESK
jgi:hypothetical protein